VLRLGGLILATLLLTAVACGDGGESSEPTATNVPSTGITPAQARTPPEDALLDEVIGLAVELGAMSNEEAECVFREHPAVYQEFLRESGLTETGNVNEADLREQFEALERENVVELRDCFTGAPAG
jgi:hypothetical protein